MGWHDGHYGDGGFGGPGAYGHDPAWGLFMLLGPLLWLVAPLAITAAYLWLRNRRRGPALAGQPLVQMAGANELVVDDPSAFEVLRRRYVLGEIDVPTFEAMTERLLISERAEELRPPVIRSARYDRYLRRDTDGITGRPEAARGYDAQPQAADIIWL